MSDRRQNLALTFILLTVTLDAIGIGLIFDTLIVRSFMTPSIAALLGRWFWWPLKVRPRPASAMLRPYGTRESVRELLHDDEAEKPGPEKQVVPAGDRPLA